ncbi:MAG: hypothetical protein QXK24_00240 [Ignisphaera sp.]
MNERTLTEGDILYFGFYLKDKDETTGSITYHDLSLANSVVFRMRKYGETANAIEVNMQVIEPTKGFCRVLVTVPPSGIYLSEVEVFETEQNITWEGPVFIVKPQLG